MIAVGVSVVSVWIGVQARRRSTRQPHCGAPHADSDADRTFELELDTEYNDSLFNVAQCAVMRDGCPRSKLAIVLLPNSAAVARSCWDGLRHAPAKLFSHIA